MNGESIVGAIIGLVIYWGCGALFYGIGAFGEKSKKPMGFWSGMELKAEWVKDIPSYNHENAVMWKLYSIPYFLAGILAVLGIWHVGFTFASVAVLMAACLPGLFLLIRHYKKIETKYIIREMLDKVDPFC